MAYLPVPNQSVSGTVGASVLGLTPVSVSNFPVTPGSTVAFQGTSPWVVTGSVQAEIGNSSVLVLNFPTNQSVSGAVSVSNLPGNQSVSGTVGASVVGHAPVVIIGGSVAASFTPPANQSVSGTVDVGNFPSNQSVSGAVSVSNFPTTQNVSGSVVATQGTTPWAIGNSSVQVVNFPANQSVSGAVQIAGGSPASIATVERVDGILSGSALGLVTATVIHGETTQGGGGAYLAAKVNPASRLLVEAEVEGSVVSLQGGPWRVSVVSSNPSSMLVGASIIGLTPVSVTFPANQSVSGAVSVSNFPTTQNVSGSVVSFQGGAWFASVSGTTGASIIGTVPVTQTTVPWTISSVYGNVSGSVVAFQGAGWSGSVAATVTNTNLNVSGSVVSFGTRTSVVTLSSVLSSISTVTLLASNPARKGATIFNTAGTTVFTTYGTTAQTSIYSVALFPNDYLEVPFDYTGAVAGITASNAGFISVTEMS